MKSWCLFFLLLFPGFGCQRFATEFESIAVRCGVPAHEVPATGSIWQLQKTNAESLNAAQLSSAEARLIRPDGKPINLPITSRACVFVPDEEGILMALVKDSDLHAAKRLSGEMRPGVQFLSLQTGRPSGFHLNCPDNILYASTDFIPPVEVPAQEGLDSVEIILTAKAEDSRQEFELLNKAYGTRNLALTQKPLPIGMKEGMYRLSLQWRSSISAWDLSGTNNAIEPSCRLYLQKSAPIVMGLKGTSDNSAALLAQGDRLPWYAVSKIPQNTLVCREKIGGDEDERKEASACEAKNHCLSADNFEAIDDKRADEAGVFHYFIKAQDRAGLSSQTHCEKVVVSSGKPFLAVSWNESSWNQELAVMSSAAVDIKAQVSASHPELEDQGIMKQLECKVDFRLAQNVTIPGRDVVCSEGLCQGQNLEDFRACSPNIRFGLGNFWKNNKAQRMQLRLHVRASAASGQQQSSVASIWIYPERFQPIATGPSTEGPIAVYESDDGAIIAQHDLKMQRWDDVSKSWQEVPLNASATITNVKSFQTSDKKVYAFWKEGSVTRAVVWNESTWTALPAHPQLSACLAQRAAYSDGGFFCQDRGDALIWHNEAWQLMGLPKDCTLSGYIFNPHLQTLPQGPSYAACNSGTILMKSADSAWEEIGFLENRNIFLDKQGRLWLLGQPEDPQDGFDQLSYYDRGTWHRVLSRPPRLESRSWSLLVQTADGDIAYDDFLVPQEAEGKWQRIPGIAQAFPGIRTLIYPGSQSGIEYLANSYGFGLKKAERLEYFPLTAFGIQPYDGERPVYDAAGRFWFIGFTDDDKQRSIYRIDPTIWQSYAEETGSNRAPPYALPVSVAVNNQDEFEIFDRWSGLSRYTGQGWEKVFPAVTLGGMPIEDLALDAQGYYYGQSADDLKVYSWVPPAAPQPLIKISSLVDFWPRLDYQGRVWAVDNENNKLIVMSGGRAQESVLPNTFKNCVKKLLMLSDRIIVGCNGRGYMVWSEAEQTWQSMAAAELKLPTQFIYWEQISANHLVYQLSRQKTLTQVDLDTLQTVVLPEVPGMDVRRLRKTTYGTFLLSSTLDVYRLNQDQWELIQAAAEWKDRNPGFENASFREIFVDSVGRIWLQGAFILRIDWADRLRQRL